MKTANEEEKRLKLKNTVSAANLSEAVKELDVVGTMRDKLGANIVPTSAVFPVDPNTNPILNYMPSIVYGSPVPSQAGGNNILYQATVIRSQGTFATSGPVSGTGNGLMVIEPYIKTGGLEAKRTPDTFKHQLCTTVAATAVWTPAGGKKFRIMGYVICPDAGMAAAGIQLITLLDSAAAITIAHQTYLPIAASIVHQVPIVVQLPGNGYLSAVADNVLNVTLTTAVTAGAISVFVYGTEE